MGLFGSSSPFDQDVEKATSEKNTTEEWGLIMDICDKVGSSSLNAKDCLRAIVRRLGNPDPHIVVQAITLLDACVNNCGRSFHLEIASREFETEYRRLLSRAQPAIAQKLKGLLKKWCDGEFKTEPQLNLIPSLMSKLKSEGVDFNDITDMPSRKKEYSSRTSATVTSASQKEQDDIERAIELSLQENKQSSPRNTINNTSNPSSALYPTMSQLAGAPQEPYKVRALYDFEAAEDNELTFLSGEIIHVSDSSDPNWWKGYNQRGEGLFPANFVTSDLSAEPQNIKTTERKSVQFNESVEVKKIERSNSPEPNEPVEIDEVKIDRLISLLHEANPEDSSTDTQEMLYLEGEVNRMGPLIDMELEQVDRKHAHLTQLSADLVDALNLYHTLMREPAHLKQPQGPYPQALPHLVYNGTSGYGSMTSMPPYYTQVQQPTPSGNMGLGSTGGLPTHIGVPSGVLPHQSQQMGPPSIGPMTQVSTLSHMPQPGAPPPTPQMIGASSHPQYASIPHSSGAPNNGLYLPAPPGPPHSYVM